MTRTPDEIKKGLECCQEDECFGERENCPYTADPNLCVGVMCGDALALIQQLENDKDDLLEERELNDFLRDKVKQLEADKKRAMENAVILSAAVRRLEAERDAAVNFLRSMGCDTCMYDDYDGSEPPCINCTAERDYWMWRGVQKEDSTC